MHISEKGRMPSSESGPATCKEEIHHFNKWAEWRVEYPDGKIQNFCMWCFLGRSRKLPKGCTIQFLELKKIQVK